MRSGGRGTERAKIPIALIEKQNGELEFAGGWGDREAKFLQLMSRSVGVETVNPTPFVLEQMERFIAALGGGRVGRSRGKISSAMSEPSMPRSLTPPPSSSSRWNDSSPAGAIGATTEFFYLMSRGD